jgi:hypothetical protein
MAWVRLRRLYRVLSWPQVCVVGNGVIVPGASVMVVLVASEDVAVAGGAYSVV